MGKLIWDIEHYNNSQIMKHKTYMELLPLY